MNGYEWDPTAGDPNAGVDPNAGNNTGAFDQYGSMSGPGSNSTIFGGTANDPFGAAGLPEWLKGVLGIGRGATSRDIGNLGGAGLGYLGSEEQQRMFQHLADRYWGMGAPYRQRLENTYTDPVAWLRSPEVQAPVQQGSDIMARSLSMGGNPAQSGNALQQLQNYSSNQLFGRLGDYRSQLMRAGGMDNQTGAVTGATGKAIESVGNKYNAAGSAMNNIFSPPPAYPQRMSNSSGLGDLASLFQIGSSVFGML